METDGVGDVGDWLAKRRFNRWSSLEGNFAAMPFGPKRLISGVVEVQNFAGMVAERLLGAVESFTLLPGRPEKVDYNENQFKQIQCTIHPFAA